MSLSDEGTQETGGRADCLLARLLLPREFAGAPSARGPSVGQGHADPGTRRFTLVRAAGEAYSQDRGLPCCGNSAAGGGCRVGCC